MYIVPLMRGQEATVRAFMSKTADQRDFGERPSRALCIILAEREARRILAETEPQRDSEGWQTAHVPANFPEHGHDALADALTAFVAEEE